MARRTLRRSRQMVRYRRFSLHGVPVLFANSFPKSGTHLLTQVLGGFTRLGPAVNSGLQPIITYQGDTGAQRSQEEITRDLERLLPGDVAYGHLHATPENIHLLTQDGFVTSFLLRDPRDVAVSHVYYVTEMEEGHIHHEYYTRTLKSFEERLRTSILGIPAAAGQNTPLLPDIYQRFAPYLGWLDQPAVLVLHFEDLIQERRGSLRAILSHVAQSGFPISCEDECAIQILERSINPDRSPTFRQGRIGVWKEVFSEQHRMAFKQVSGDLLVRLGYERDDNW